MLERASRTIDRVSCVLMATLLAAMVVVIFAQVLWRYTFQASIFWSEELSRYLMIWATMFGAGVCLWRGAHMAVRLVHDLFPARIRQLITLFVYVLILAFLSVVVWYGGSLVRRMWYQLSPTLQLPMGLVYMAVPLGAFLMSIHTLSLLEKIWRTGGIDEPRKEKAYAKEG